MELIIVDGLDGVGKDTHAALIKHYFESKNQTVLIRSHPCSDNFYGRQSKKALLGQGKINQLKASMFYALDVLNSLRCYYRKSEFDILIMVRYLMGTAYLPPLLASFAYHFFEKFVPTSGLMFFLDAPPEELLKRIHTRSELEMFETYDALVDVRKKALVLTDGWYIIDTSGSVEQTFGQIQTILDLYN